MDTCGHVRPRRCCRGCRAWYLRFYGEIKWRQRFDESLAMWRKRRRQ